MPLMDSKSSELSQVVRFVPDARHRVYSTTLLDIAPDELNAAYTRASRFFLDKNGELQQKYGWKAQDVRDPERLFTIDGVLTAGDKTYNVQLHLPRTFTSFLDASKFEEWQQMFENYELFQFHARQPDRHSKNPFIECIPPLADIFYLLQCLAPGMLQLNHINMFYVLPRPTWIIAHQEILEAVLGSKDNYANMLRAASDDDKSHCYGALIVDSNDDEDDEREDTYYDNSDDYYTTAWGFREVKDYTACDAECGYCGTCEY